MTTSIDHILRLVKTVTILIFTVILLYPHKNAGSEPLSPGETVTLQLKWLHQFQFAGYYAAKEIGYYEEEGLNVHIQKRNPKDNNIRRVLDGHADYGVADSIILLYRMRGEPLVLLAPVFQQSPLVYITLKDSGIESPYQIAGTRVMTYTPETDDLPLKALLHELGIQKNEYSSLPVTTDPHALLDKTVDVYPAYVTNEPFCFRQKNIKINIIDPRNYGVDFYGDMLFTTRNELENHPGRSERFLRASLKGWKYALNHTEEIIDLIVQKYDPEKSRDHLRYEADTVKRMIKPEFITLGKLDTGRLQYIAKTLKRMGFIEHDDLPENFIHPQSLNASLDFTQHQTQWLKTRRIIRVASETDWPPFDFVEDGLATGYSIDLLNLVAGKAGLRLKFVNGYTWNTLMEMGKQKKVDLFPAIWKTREREQFLLFSIPYIDTPHILVVHADEKQVYTIDDLKGRILAGIKGFASTNLAKNSYPEIKVVEVINAAEGLRMVSYGKADAYLGSYGETDFEIKRHLISNLKIAGETTLGGRIPASQLHFAVRKDWPQLHGIIQKSLAAVTPEEKRILQAKWIRPETKPQTLSLTDKEREWIKQHPVLRVAFDVDWPPVEFVDESGTMSGIAADYLKRVSDLLRIRFEPASPTSWHRMMQSVKNGDLDFFSAISPTEQRNRWLSFTDSYISFPIVIVTRKDVPYIGSMEDLSGKTIAVVKDYASHDLLSGNHPEMQLLPTQDIHKGLMAVLKGQAFAFIGSLAASSHIMVREGLSDLKVSGETPYKFNISMGIPKENTLLLNLLQKALAAIPSHERNAIFSKWIRVTYQPKPDYSLVWKVIAVALIIFIIILNRNRRLKAMAEELKTARDAAETANRAKSVFLANVSHEIRTPMNAIVGLSHLALQTPLSPTQKDYQQKIQSAAGALSRLIDDILDISKIEAGKLELEHRSFSLEDVLQNLVSLIGIKSSEKGLTFKVNVDEGVHSYLVGDALRLGQVLSNLATNAVKFTHKGEITVKVEQIQQTDNDVLLRFSVCDTGIGMDTAKINQLFKPFCQADASISRKYGGTGLGLTISKYLIRLMGGDIHINSSTNAGTEISFTVRFDKSEYTEPIHEKNVSIESSTRFLSDKRLLLVEDNDINQQVAREILEHVGILVTTAENGLQALEMVNKQPFDIVLMDLQMPEMDGLSASKEIRKKFDSENLPIIAMTANAMTEDKERCINAGMNDHVSKPIDPEHLYRTLLKWLKADAFYSSS